MSGIRVFNAAVSQLQSSQKNLFAISQARQKLDREKEKFEWEKKKSNLELEGLEMSNTMKKDQLEARKKISDAALKIMEEQLNQKSAMIDAEESNQQTMAEQAMTTAKGVAKADPYVLAPYFTAEGGAGLRPIKTGGSGTTKGAITRKDIIAEARRLWEDDGKPDYTTINDYMQDAEDLLTGRSTPKTKGKPTSKITGPKVKVKAPDGRVGHIPKENLERAKQLGYITF